MLFTVQEWSALRLSLQVSLVATVCSLPLAIVVAYALARGTWRGRFLVEVMVNLPLVLPPVVTGYLLLLLLGRNGVLGVLGLQTLFTWKAAAIAAGVVSFPLMVRSVRLSFAEVNPRLAQAAQSLGATPLRAFVTVTVPLARRGLFAGAVLGFARSVGEFGATIMVAGNIPGQTQTIPLAIFAHTQRPGGMEQSWRLVAFSIVIACTALAVSEWLDARARRQEHA